MCGSDRRNLRAEDDARSHPLSEPTTPSTGGNAGVQADRRPHHPQPQDELPGTGSTDRASDPESITCKQVVSWIIWNEQKLISSARSMNFSMVKLNGQRRK